MQSKQLIMEMKSMNEMLIKRTVAFEKKKLKTLMIKIILELEIIVIIQVNIKILHIAYEILDVKYLKIILRFSQ